MLPKDNCASSPGPGPSQRTARVVATRRTSGNAMDFDGDDIEASLLRISRISGSAGMIDAIMHTISDLTAALSPVIGDRGAAALYARSVHVARRTHAWLPDERQ